MPAPLSERSPARASQTGTADVTAIDVEAVSGPEPNATRLAPGKIIPGTRLRLLRWIGDGGMGVVYEAEHVDLQRKVAVKVLRPAFAQDPERLFQFRDEARAAATVGSRHIVDVTDFDALPDGRPYLVMELLDGENLDERLERESRLSIEAAWPILREACKGLHAAHKAGIVHRDVKPGNLFIARDADGRGEAVKVLDFGIASVGGVALADLTSGTPNYMPPEQIRGSEFDARLDVYALACVAFRMFTGSAPFASDSVEEVLRQHLDVEPPTFAERGVDLPEPVERVLREAMAKDQQLRPKDCAEFEARLCEAQIEAGFTTGRDEIPLPEDIDPERRARLLSAMPADAVPSSNASLRWGVVGALLIAAVAIVFAMRAPPQAQHPQVVALSEEARNAAAAALWVYPPPDAPETPTARTKVEELEGLEGDAAGAADAEGERLRGVFAEALVQLGDRYWDREGGRPFAMDFYAQALVFDAQHDKATRLAGLTPGQVVALGRKAAKADFSEDELIAAEPLVALAIENSDKRKKALAALGKRRRKQPSYARAQVRELMEGEGVEAVPAPEPEPTPVAPVVAAVEPEPAVEAEPEATPGAKPSAKAKTPRSGNPPPPAVAPKPVPKRDPAGAAQQVKQGRAALLVGDWRKAESAFHRALASDSRSAVALIGLADVYFDRGSHAKAAAFARRAVNAAPRNADYRLRLGDAYFKTLKYDRAKAAYEKALSLGHRKAKARLDKLERTLGK